MKMKSCILSVLCLALLTIAGCLGKKDQDPRDDLAAIAGRMAAENDLREVRFEDLDKDGQREVIMVFGPRELLNFDVFYQKSGSWEITPMVNDKNNPREFVSSSLDSIYDSDKDNIPVISVSSRLYDGNTMVKELHWMPGGYEVIGQRTVIAQPEPVQLTQKPVSAERGRTVTQPPNPVVEKKPEPKPEPKPILIPPVTPATGTYMIKKGDTVFGLARALGVSADELENLNNKQLASRGLRIGQKITVPVPRGKTDGVTVRIEKERYTVKKGDSLSLIARNYGVDVRTLKSWNHDLPADGSINVGQTLNIHHAVIDISS